MYVGEFDDGDFGPDGSFTRTTPSSGEDWVLVIDDASQGFEAPGTVVPYEIPEDVNGDGVVDVLDLMLVISAWGPCAGCPEDIDGSGQVDVIDLLAVISAWS